MVETTRPLVSFKISKPPKMLRPRVTDSPSPIESPASPDDLYTQAQQDHDSVVATPDYDARSSSSSHSENDGCRNLAHIRISASSPHADASEVIDLCPLVIDASDLSNPLTMAYPSELHCKGMTFKSMLHAYYWIMSEYRGKPGMTEFIDKQFEKGFDRLPDIAILPNTVLFPSAGSESPNRQEEQEVLAGLLTLKKIQCPKFTEALRAPPPSLILIKSKDEHLGLGCGTEDADLTCCEGENLYGKTLLNVWKLQGSAGGNAATEQAGAAKPKNTDTDAPTTKESSTTSVSPLKTRSSDESGHGSFDGRGSGRRRKSREMQRQDSSSDREWAKESMDVSPAKGDLTNTQTSSIDKGERDASPVYRRRDSPVRRYPRDRESRDRARRRERSKERSANRRNFERDSSAKKDRSEKRRRRSRDRSRDRRSRSDERRNRRRSRDRRYSRDRSSKAEFVRSVFRKEPTPAPMRTGFYGHCKRMTRGRGRGGGGRGKPPKLNGNHTPLGSRQCRSPTLPYWNGQPISGFHIPNVWNGPTSVVDIPLPSSSPPVPREKEPATKLSKLSHPESSQTEVFSPLSVEKEPCSNTSNAKTVEKSESSLPSIDIVENKGVDRLSLGCHSLTPELHSNPISPAESSPFGVDIPDSPASPSPTFEEPLMPVKSVLISTSSSDAETATVARVAASPQALHDDGMSPCSETESVEEHETEHHSSSLQTQRYGEALPLAFPDDLRGLLADCFMIAVERRNQLR